MSDELKNRFFIGALILLTSAYIWYLYEQILLTRKMRKNVKFEHNDVTHFHKHEYFFEQGTQIFTPKHAEELVNEMV